MPWHKRSWPWGYAIPLYNHVYPPLLPLTVCPSPHRIGYPNNHKPFNPVGTGFVFFFFFFNVSDCFRLLCLPSLSIAWCLRCSDGVSGEHSRTGLRALPRCPDFCSFFFPWSLSFLLFSRFSLPFDLHHNKFPCGKYIILMQMTYSNERLRVLNYSFLFYFYLFSCYSQFQILCGIIRGN
jgi:hypothetical protein